MGRASALIKRRGVGYLWYLLDGVAIPKLWYHLALDSAARESSLARRFADTSDDRWLERFAAEASIEGAASTRAGLTLSALSLDDETAARIWAATISDDVELILARLVHGEAVSAPFGPLTGLALPRPADSSTIHEVVLAGGMLRLRVRFAPGSDAFLRTRVALARLADVPSIPDVLAADERAGTLSLSLAPGQVLAEGPLRSTADDDFVRRTDLAMHAIHRRGVSGFGVEPGSVVRGRDGEPLFYSWAHARFDGDATSLRFATRRNLDRSAFNERYGTALLTERVARTTLESLRSRLTSYQDYAPIDYGQGLTLGSIAVTDSGTGRWDFFNRHVVAPEVVGKRVLDLGSNNGSMPTAMLRAGARELHCVEMNPTLADLCTFSARLFEWRDMRPYALTMHLGDMASFLSEDWGRFDVVTAFCSLYYLDRATMAAIVRKVASMGATIILQSNEGIDESLKEEASAVFLETLLRTNGFAQVEASCPPGYARVLLVGRPGV